MQTLSNRSLRSLLVLSLLLPFITFAQSEDMVIHELPAAPTAVPLAEPPAPPAFLESIETEEDFVNLTPAQQEEVNQYFAGLAQVSTVIANVNLQNTAIVSQDKGTFKISFELANGKGVQTGIKYGLSLIRETDQGQFVVDSKVYPEVLTLGENSTIKKDITYTAPGGLSGEYMVLLESKTDAGLRLGLGLAGTVILAPDQKGLEILTDTCFIQVAGEAGSPEYFLSQGVDVTSEETLQLSCEVNNYSPYQQVVTPAFETYFRTMFGEVVPADGGSTEEITFAGNETKTVLITLPKALSPQAFDVKMSLKSTEAETNSVIAHYVLVGSSATIQNVILDKVSYQAGETANVSFVWSLSADSFPDSRHEASSPSATTLDVSITSRGVDCIAPETITLEPNQNKTELTFPVTASCSYPVLSLSLKDTNGDTLDSSVLTPNGLEEVVLVPVTDTESSNSKTLVMLGLLLFVIALIYAYMKRQSDRDVMEDVVMKSLLVLLLVGGVYGGGVDGVEAGGVSFLGYRGAFVWDGEGTLHTYYVDGAALTVNTDKDVYAPGEVINFTSSSRIYVCSNVTRKNIITATLDDRRWTVFYNDAAAGHVTYFDSGVGRAPSTPGEYTIDLSWRILGGDRGDSLSYGYGKINITVAAPACVPRSGTGCSTSNSCRDTNLGTWDCSGTVCSAAVTPERAGWSDGCLSAANICGQTTTGTYNRCLADGTVGCSITTAPSNASCPAVGNFESVTTPACKVSGWAYDPSDSTREIAVHVYRDNSAFSGGTMVANCPTNILRNDVNSAYSITGNHGFDCTLPASYFGTGSHNLYIHAIDTTGSPNNVISNSPKALSCPLPPSGEINIGSCDINPGDTQCNASVTWNTADFLGTPKVLVNSNPTPVSNAATNPPLFTVPVNYGGNSVKLEDGGSSFTDSDTVSIGCVSGSVWADDTIGCLKLPELTVSVNQNIVRNGEAGKGSVSVLADYPLNCTIIAATEDLGGLSTFTHPGSATPVVYRFTTLPLTSTQKVQVECEHPFYAHVKDTKLGRIDVTASVEER